MPRLCINSNHWELGELWRTLNLLANSRLDPNLRDGWDRSISRKGRFTIKSLYLALTNQGSIDFPHRGVWILGIPSKVSFFIWDVVLDKILSLDHL